MPPISRARLARIEKAIGADLDATRKIWRLEKIAADVVQHPARRARALDGVMKMWRDAAAATPSKASGYLERARVAAAKAASLRVQPHQVVAARLAALQERKPMPAFVPDPDLHHDPDSPAARLLRDRLSALDAAHRRGKA